MHDGHGRAITANQCVCFLVKLCRKLDSDSATKLRHHLHENERRAGKKRPLRFSLLQASTDYCSVSISDDDRIIQMKTENIAQCSGLNSDFYDLKYNNTVPYSSSFSLLHNCGSWCVLQKRTYRACCGKALASWDKKRAYNIFLIQHLPPHYLNLFLPFLMPAGTQQGLCDVAI
jgi:hypothetical protein